MASYSDLEQIARQTDFQNRICYALYSAAVAVYAEDAGTVGHAARIVFAKKVLTGQYDILSAANAVLTNPTIAAGANPDGKNGNNISDGDMQFSMNSIYNGLAGA